MVLTPPPPPRYHPHNAHKKDLLGIQKKDKAGRAAQVRKNFEFFVSGVLSV